MRLLALEGRKTAAIMWLALGQLTGCGSGQPEELNGGGDGGVVIEHQLAVDTPRSPSRATRRAEVSASPPRDSLDALLAILPEVQGLFTRVLGWEFVGDREVLTSFYPFGDEAVRALVDCMDDPRLTSVLAEGERVPMGVLCAEALGLMAYAAEHEDGDGDWVGTVEPTATPAELKAAKDAWLEVVESGGYRIS